MVKRTVCLEAPLVPVPSSWSWVIKTHPTVDPLAWDLGKGRRGVGVEPWRAIGGSASPGSRCSEDRSPIVDLFRYRFQRWVDKGPR
jgi:hypothetical protein